MKILVIDDQQLVLLPLEKKLTELGYVVLTQTSAEKGIASYDSYEPDLVIVDINMPDRSGLDVVKHIRLYKKSKTPIMVLSGNTKDQTIMDAYDLGIDDFMKKPLSLNEIYARIKHLVGPATFCKISQKVNLMIQQKCVGVVIPCYNEEKRLLSDQFINFIEKNSGYHLCFVNDGSTDNTIDVLHKIRKGKEKFISVYDCKKNQGKAEAVRLGMLHMAKKDDLDYIGFLDADLSTNFANFDDLVKVIENSKYKIVSGSRISRMGANISKESSRKLISLSINYIIRKILKMNFKDTQCGAKIFSKDIIPIAFNDPFITKWLFDVEIFMRVRNYFSLENSKELLCETPLKRWVHADGSKLSMKDSIKIIGQLAQIAWVYSFNKKTTKTTVLES